MKRVFTLLFLFCTFFTLIRPIVESQSGYEFFIIDTLIDGDLDSCSNPEKKCSLNSAIYIAEETSLKTVLLIKIPYKFDSEFDYIPFYLVNEDIGDENIWKLQPAPLTSNTDFSNIKQDITDYFLTLNIGNLETTDSTTLISALFFGQFRKYYSAEERSSDYDLKNSIYRIVNIPE